MADHAEHSHPVHVPHRTPWPLCCGMGMMATAFGALPLLYGYPAGWILVVIGIFLFLLGVFSWLADMRAEHQLVVAGKVIPEFPKIGAWMVGFIILSEVFLFGTLFASYFYLHALDVKKTQSFLNFFTLHGEIFQTFGPVVYMNTFLLLASSVTVQIGEHWLKHGKIRRFQFWLVITVIFGAAFVGGQVYEYIRFITVDGFSMEASMYGTLFFALTGLHGLHVSVGALLLIWLLVGSYKKQFSEKHHVAVTVISIYWHFVDLIWLFLVSVLYLRLF
jgi:cytochrome c oxidase subunit 3